MKKIFTTLICGVMTSTVFGQWTPTVMQGEKTRPETQVKNYYGLDLNILKSQLSGAVEAGKSSKAVIVSLPTLEGKIEKFAVFSAPVAVKALAEKYDLGSYSGVSISDPTKSVRFSLSGNDFQSMTFSNGNYEFIEPQNAAKTVYGVFPKSNKTDKAFDCSTNESILGKAELDKLRQNSSEATQNNSFAKASDQKFRTYRLAISVTGEYTQFFGGVPQALAAINATMTRVNGVFEKDFAVRMILQDFPALIYTDPNTDPYSPAATGAGGAWNLEVQKTMTTVIGNAAYDIGHLFGRSGGGGSAGDIGNVCRNPANANDDTSKGSGFTSPGTGGPAGDTFDIDYVAHEMGHQFGADHTFSHAIQGAPYNSALMEPGSGSTIMGYAGITNANVQQNSDAYFHVRSIEQVQTYTNSQTCAVSTAIANTPPVVAPMASVTIPKGTAFVLTASATDAQNDPLTYTWEEYDVAATAVTVVTGNNVTGAKFRSLTGTASPTRYFPKLSLVLAGTLSSQADWEAVSNIARTTNFRVTVRDNNADVTKQQTAIGVQNMTVGSAGPFKVTSTKVYTTSGPITWDVASTSAAPYNVPNVKIDYTVDNGVNWIVLAASTPNDGSENFSFASTPLGTQLKVRVSAIGNVFYAIAPVVVSAIIPCDGTAPVALAASAVTSAGATLTWDPIATATYIVRYKKAADATFTEVPVATNTYTITGLEEGTAYNAQVAAVCSGTTGTFSQSITFNTLSVAYCTLTSTNSADEFISNVKITAEGATGVNSTSGASNYTNYSADPTRLVRLAKGTANNTLSVTKSWTGTKFNEGISVWIDFDRSGTYDASELVMSTTPNQTTPETIVFAVPANAYSGDKTVGMRVVLRFNTTQTAPCGTFTYGEVEDYAVSISPTLGVNDSSNVQAVTVYPNPAADVLNITKVSNNANYVIYNIAGQLMAKGKIVNNKVQVSQLQKGVYMITVDNNGQTSKVKFIKK